MTDRITDRITRRSALKTLAVTGAAGLAGCGGSNSESETSYAPTDIPPREYGIPEWGQKLNEHAREANIDWTQFEGEDIELTFGMGLHPYSTTFSARPDPQNPDGPQIKDWFEDLTGISVNYEIVSEDQFWLETENALSNGEGRYDGIMCGLWPAGGYHYGTDGESWVRDLQQYIDDASLTDKEWLAMDDFLDQTIELMTFPNEDGTSDFVGFPNGIEAYGCTAVHKPTLEQVGASEPTSFDELQQVAQLISSSHQTQREGIISRTSSTTLSAANWATMFRTYGGEWIDREEQVATLDSEAGIASLEHFAGMLNEYGPQDPGTYDWYANNNAYSEGRVGMMYSTPQTSGFVNDTIMEETKWLPPMAGPDGQDPVASTWVWSTAITATTDHPEAAWLYLQWANSRQANLMLSTQQWQNDEPRAGYARLNWVEQQVNNGNAPPVPGEGYMEAFRQGMEAVPGGDPSSPGEYPPVPVETPQCMNIMTEVAQAMSNTVSNGADTAADELSNVAPRITDYASRIPDRYIAPDRFA